MEIYCKNVNNFVFYLHFHKWKNWKINYSHRYFLYICRPRPTQIRSACLRSSFSTIFIWLNSRPKPKKAVSFGACCLTHSTRMFKQRRAVNSPEASGSQCERGTLRQEDLRAWRNWRLEFAGIFSGNIPLTSPRTHENICQNQTQD